MSVGRPAGQLYLDYIRCGYFYILLVGPNLELIGMGNALRIYPVDGLEMPTKGFSSLYGPFSLNRTLDR